jgi:hypothetical protein
MMKPIASTGGTLLMIKQKSAEGTVANALCGAARADVSVQGVVGAGG